MINHLRLVLYSNNSPLMITWNSIFFHSPSSYLIEIVIFMHDYVIIFLFSVLIIVIINLAYSFFSYSYNSEFFERHQLERVWTFLPFVLLIFIVLPSLNVLYSLDTCLFCGMSVRIMGHQWYWRYFYKDFKNILFDSYINPQDSSFLRLIDVDNRLIIPTFFPVRFMVSSADVIHSWTIPSFGVKIDAVPGRINQFCFSGKRSGIFFGQCSEICGANHSFIPIVLESIPFKSLFPLYNTCLDLLFHF